MGDTWQNIMAGGFQSPASVGGYSPSNISGSIPVRTSTPDPISSLAGAGAGDSGTGLNFNLGQAWNANQLAQKTFNFQRDVMNTNLTNSIKSYNTQLEDRARSRAVTEGQTDQQRQDYVDRNRLAR
jgi:hypothetical protein